MQYCMLIQRCCAYDRRPRQCQTKHGWADQGQVLIDAHVDVNGYVCPARVPVCLSTYISESRTQMSVVCVRPGSLTWNVAEWPAV